MYDTPVVYYCSVFEAIVNIQTLFYQIKLKSINLS